MSFRTRFTPSREDACTPSRKEAKVSKDTQPQPRDGNVPATSPQPSQTIRSAKVTTREDVRRDTYTASRDGHAAATPGRT